MDVTFYVRNDHLGAFHNPSTHDYDFGVVGVNQADSIRRPDIETTVPDGDRNRISPGSFFKEFFEADIGILRERALGNTLPIFDHQRKRPS